MVWMTAAPYGFSCSASFAGSWARIARWSGAPVLWARSLPAETAWRVAFLRLPSGWASATMRTVDMGVLGSLDDLRFALQLGEQLLHVADLDPGLARRRRGHLHHLDLRRGIHA